MERADEMRAEQEALQEMRRQDERAQREQEWAEKEVELEEKETEYIRQINAKEIDEECKGNPDSLSEQLSLKI
jgi:hypothetical protein